MRHPIADVSTGLSDDSDQTPSYAWTVWQLLDSAFPAGSFAHSGGIEAAHAHGIITDRAEAIVRESLLQAAHGSSPFASAAFDCGDDFLSIDSECDAFITNHVGNRASRRQGASLLRASSQIFPDALPDEYQQAWPHDTPGHFGPVFGLIAAGLHIPRLVMHEMLVFMTMRAGLSAATRLGIVGPLEAQRLLTTMSGEAKQIAHRAADLTRDDVAQHSPLLEIVQGNHDQLYSRLFQS